MKLQKEEENRTQLEGVRKFKNLHMHVRRTNQANKFLFLYDGNQEAASF